MKTPLLITTLALTSAAFAADDDKDFKPLFNGKDLTGRHPRNPGANKKTWKVIEGVLKNDLQPGQTASIS